jgi:hypothetical protein
MYEIFSRFKSKKFFQIRKVSEVLNKKIFFVIRFLLVRDIF